MLSYRTGIASTNSATGLAMARYLNSEPLRPEPGDRARYYSGEFLPEPANLVENLGQQIMLQEVTFSDALDTLMRIEVRAGTEDLDAAEERLSKELADAAESAWAQGDVSASGGTVSGLREDIDPAIAARLGIDPTRNLSEREISHLLSGKRADGVSIEGKKIDRPMLSVFETFALPGYRLPSLAEIDTILASDHSSARKRFLAAYGVVGREPTERETEHIRSGRLGSGAFPDGDEVLRKLNASKPPIAYVDMVWSPDKSVSVAWALAETEAERAAILWSHKDAVTSAMAYTEQRLGYLVRKEKGHRRDEAGSMAWVNFHHYTSRPTLYNEAGEHKVDPPPGEISDPQIHTHSILLSIVLGKNGHIGSPDRDKLDGLVKELGGVYQALVARNLRRHGIDVALDPKVGSARIVAIPDDVKKLFSRRHDQTEKEAQRLAVKLFGKDFDKLLPEDQITLLAKAVGASRRAKTKDAPSDFSVWRKEAAAIGYRHRSVLRPDEIRPEREARERHQFAYDLTNHRRFGTENKSLIERAWNSRAKWDGQDLREIAARGLIEAGIDDPWRDIGAVTEKYRTQGMMQEGKLTEVIWGRDVPIRGKPRWSVTTGMHERDEARVIELASQFARDRSAALKPRHIERVVREFLAARPEIDRNGAQWRKQREIIDKLGTGGRLGLAIGVAGAGKSALISPLVAAYRARGRTVYGTARAHRHAGLLADAGIEPSHRAALDPFIKRVEDGRFKLDKNAVVFIEELSLVGEKHFLQLLELQQKLGFQMLAIGDSAQGQAVSMPVIKILEKALGRDNIPEILTSVRQRTEREQEIALLFRDGQAGQAIAMKREDGTAELVPGGYEATVKRVAALWRERMEANVGDRDFRLTVSAPTNADAHALGVAIREQMRAMGRLHDHIGKVTLPFSARGESGEMEIAPGDRLRLFDRVFTADRKWLGDNGSVVEVVNVGRDGMTARNEAGLMAVFSWDKLRNKGGPVRLAYGYALTNDTVQGLTSTEHIDVLPGGSGISQGLKGYVAESRHRVTTWLVVNDSAERKEVSSRIPLGAERKISEADVWANIGKNLSRQPSKALAGDFLRSATELNRGGLALFQRSMEPVERRDRNGDWRDVAERMEIDRADRHPGVRHVAERAREAVRQIIERFHDRDRSRGMER